MTKSRYELTNDELVQLDTMLGIHRVSVSDVDIAMPVRDSKPLLRKSEEVLPLEHEAASESFLVAELEGRVRLSDETRLREEHRLHLRNKKRKPYKWRDGSRKHWKTKKATKDAYKRRRLQEHPLASIKASFRQHINITDDEWQRLVQPVWDEHKAETLRVRWTGGRCNVYTLRLETLPKGKRASPQVVYDGGQYMIDDSMDDRYKERVLALLTA